MSKHTPGPWEMFCWDDNGTPVIGVKPGNRGDVADCSINNYRPLEELQANARLMAAAPDLLAVATECLDAELARRARLKPGAPATTYCEARIERVTAAIAKAKGEA